MASCVAAKAPSSAASFRKNSASAAANSASSRAATSASAATGGDKGDSLSAAGAGCEVGCAICSGCAPGAGGVHLEPAPPGAALFDLRVFGGISGGVERTRSGGRC